MMRDGHQKIVSNISLILREYEGFVLAAKKVELKID
jgi:hypothetical protein